jgi:metal-responsive CopG/Arc/MetJ family transcriptional regulator
MVIPWYDWCMAGFKKVAVSIPDDTFRSMEEARTRLGSSRSAVISAAVTQWLQTLEDRLARQRYRDGYLRVPETSSDDELITAATSDWSSWEPGKPSRAAEARPRRRR